MAGLSRALIRTTAPVLVALNAIGAPAEERRGGRRAAVLVVAAALALFVLLPLQEPTLRALRCFNATYIAEAGSSPTSTVASRGREPPREIRSRTAFPTSS